MHDSDVLLLRFVEAVNIFGVVAELEVNVEVLEAVKLI
jgi:hypothetical protein